MQKWHEKCCLWLVFELVSLVIPWLNWQGAEQIRVGNPQSSDDSDSSDESDNCAWTGLPVRDYRGCGFELACRNFGLHAPCHPQPWKRRIRFSSREKIIP